MNTISRYTIVSFFILLFLIGCGGGSGDGNESSPALDTSAPVLSSGAPSGTLSSGTRTATLQVMTDENASCRYGTSSGTPYVDMPVVFDVTGQTTHSSTVIGLSDGNSYTYYVRCNDTSDNSNTVDYSINFNVDDSQSVDTTAPVLSNGMPLEAQPLGTQTVTLQVTTDENASCRYGTSSGTPYADMTVAFDVTGQTTHSSSVTGLSDGRSYTYYIRCNDTSDNANTIDYSINFSVLNAIAQGTPWSYVGIPYTDWAYNPFTIEPSTPTEWPTAPAQSYYFVEPGHPNATDEIQAAELTGDFGRFGYPDMPRASIPTGGWIGDEFTAGTIIWLKGGIYNGNPALGVTNFYGGWRPQFHGTAEQPIWLYGDPTDKPTFTGVQVDMHNSSYAILDNLQWIGGNTSNGALSMTVSDRAGPTHHITLRNLRFENLNYIGGGGAIIGMSSTSQTGGILHDVVAYNNVFKNNGGGYDWTTIDNDHHGYKVNGILGGNAAYRIWIIDNQAVAGDTPDPVDSIYKSLSGNLVQVGDQVSASGNNHHVYVAGNYQEYARQALGWTKKSSDVLFSSNECTDTFNGAGGNGQCYGHQYELGDYNWWINNIGRNSSSGWMHTANSAMTGPLFIVGNLFYNNRQSDRNDNWRTCSGATLYTQQGEHFFVNNVFDSQCHGIWAQTNRHTSADKLHIYNNIFTNFSANVDTTSKAISLENSNDMAIYIENNLFGSFSGDVSLNGNVYNLIADVNSQTWASNNIVGDPNYLDQVNGNYNISVGSAAVDTGTQTYGSGAPDVYQQFLDRYTNDINYPGDPADYWPKDYLKQNRVVGGSIDIGAYESQ